MTRVIDRVHTHTQARARARALATEQVSRSCVDSSEHVLQLTKAFAKCRDYG